MVLPMKINNFYPQPIRTTCPRPIPLTDRTEILRTPKFWSPATTPFCRSARAGEAFRQRFVKGSSSSWDGTQLAQLQQQQSCSGESSIHLWTHLDHENREFEPVALSARPPWSLMMLPLFDDSPGSIQPPEPHRLRMLAGAGVPWRSRCRSHAVPCRTAKADE